VEVRPLAQPGRQLLCDGHADDAVRDLAALDLRPVVIGLLERDLVAGGAGDHCAPNAGPSDRRFSRVPFGATYRDPVVSRPAASTTRTAAPREISDIADRLRIRFAHSLPIRLRDRVVQDLGDATTRLHRLVGLGFPEFTRYVKDLASEAATTILSEYPAAAAPRSPRWSTTAGTRSVVSSAKFVEAAKTSVGRHHGDAYRIQVCYAHKDIAPPQAARPRATHRGHARRPRGRRAPAPIDGIGPQNRRPARRRDRRLRALRQPGQAGGARGLDPGHQARGQEQAQRRHVLRALAARAAS
jgi:hypothetical protein